LRRKTDKDMKYNLELEVETDDSKISFTEEFFKSISFVRKVTFLISGGHLTLPDVDNEYRREIGRLGGRGGRYESECMAFNFESTETAAHKIRKRQDRQTLNGRVFRTSQEYV
jgi:hypothetical protein